MSGVVPSLFKGIAVVIDNGIGREAEIDKILQNIEESGGHAIRLLELPKENYDLEHFARASFFIMDWNFASQEGVALEAGVRLPRSLNKAMIADNIAFLKRLSQSRHAPVFIFSNEEPEVIQGELSSDPDLHKSVDESHILVRRKSDVVDKLYDVLEEWASNTPSVLTLRSWERGYLKAANDLFIDFHNRTPYWPVLLWQTFDADKIPPGVEMNKLLNRLVESRMEHLDIKLEPFLEKVAEQKASDEEGYIASVHKVLEGERFLREDKLAKNVFSPGDVFERADDNGNKTFWMNIRAECDCIRGSEGLELYLLKMKLLSESEIEIDIRNGAIQNERDGEAVIFAMLEGKTFAVQFKDLRVRTIKNLRTEKYTRVGRLLAPFSTRVQQRYSSYTQRSGMPRIPPAFYPVSKEVNPKAVEA
ncbi:hypothetical protein [Rhizobium sophoriradicis]|uniref:Response receiver domain-containing protein n=1 Tax=Rhizobium sophoriradicis TaxID=1535245 RepID=A0A2A5KIX2_9HYPH|nr:hypothetical protein [Rhizobium sophoriradicis]PCK76955.1 hypothetical protein CPT34_32655 [Rhizobium sophoriradicis]